MSQPELSAEAGHGGRKATISRDDLIAAALRLIGPHRSVGTLSLREVAREAGIAPNSFYRHFRDIDDLAVALIDLSGQSLRKIVGEARLRLSNPQGVVRASVEAFMHQVRAEDRLLHVLLREGAVGSSAFKRAVDNQLDFFETELRIELGRLSAAAGQPLQEPALVAKAITRLVFAMGTEALDSSPERDDEVIRQMSQMVRMILLGARRLSLLDKNAAGTDDPARAEARKKSRL